MSKIRIGVLRGGPSCEYDVSLRTGGHVLRHLSEEKYAPQDIFISKEGAWHMRGKEIVPVRALSGLDIVFNALHGEYGEDGTVQRLLDTHGIPYTGSGALASALAMNKALAKGVVARGGVRIPQHRIIERGENDVEKLAFELFRTFPQPVVIKPIDKGSSVGMAFADSYDRLRIALAGALENAERVLVEEYIRGREATCGIVEGYRGERHYALFPIEIVLPKGKVLFDYETKYSDLGYQKHCPGNFTADEKAHIQDLARHVHETLGLRHYSRSDFIVTPRGIYFLEVNTLPGLTEGSLVPHALREAGCAFPEFLDHVITLALEKR